MEETNIQRKLASESGCCISAGRRWRLMRTYSTNLRQASHNQYLAPTRNGLRTATVTVLLGTPFWMRVS